MQSPENRDTVYLYRIQGYCERILQYLELLQYEYQQFLSKQYMVDAIGMNLFQIGELAGRLSEPFRQATCDRMPWQRMKSMRNMFAHNYAHADLETIWNTAVVNIPPLLAFCREQLAADPLMQEIQSSCQSPEEIDL